jgi:metal-responsive CopG/Arc/MetJ family transcriptional regulator
MKTKYSNFGVSLPHSLAKRLDNARGDVPRSKLLQRLVERWLEEEAGK